MKTRKQKHEIVGLVQIEYKNCQALWKGKDDATEKKTQLKVVKVIVHAATRLAGVT